MRKTNQYRVTGTEGLEIFIEDTGECVCFDAGELIPAEYNIHLDDAWAKDYVEAVYANARKTPCFSWGRIR